MPENTLEEPLGQLIHVMFADITGSSKIYDQLGDIEARHVISHSLKLAADLVDQQNGRVIKSTGDDVLCIFDTADSAVGAAGDILDHFSDQMLFEGTTVNFHIGIHSGNGILTENDIFGDTVNVSSRLTDLAKSGQILVSEQTVLFLSNDMKAHTRRYDRIRVKGRDVPVEVFDYIWNESGEETGLIEFTGWDNSVLPRLKLEILEQQLILEPDSPRLKIGRDKSVEFKILGKMISRQHASIHFRKGKYILKDHSGNGSYVQIGNGEPVYIKNEELPLNTTGLISLGKKISDKRSMNIRFSHIFGD